MATTAHLTPRALGLVVERPAAKTGHDALAHWREWTTAHPVGSALLAGAVATHFATVFGIWFHAIGLPNLNWPATNGAIIFPKGTAVAQFAAGEFVHALDGVFFAFLFVFLVHPRIPLRDTALGNLTKGLMYGFVLAIISAAWWVPYVAFPHAGADVFSTGFGWKLVFGIFLWHLIYGYFLGTVYNPLPQDENA